LQTSPQSNRKLIALLFLAVVLLYSRALFGTIVSIDDVGIMKFYGAPYLTLIDALRPGEGYYYRPLIALSYWIDWHLLGQNALLMHLENVLIHAANVVLLYLLASRLLAPASARLPLVAALLFAVHPVNSEAVSWIAGRTDPLAALFVLLAALSLCRGLQRGTTGPILLSVLFLLCGVMAKETALLFVPASFLIIAVWRRLHPDAAAERARAQQRLLGFLYLGICLLVVAVFAVRSGAHNSVAKFFGGHVGHPGDSFLLLLSVLGFYLKKLIVPWPLNFAIFSVSPWYALPGAVSLVALVLAPKRNPWFLLCCTGFLFLLPALGVALCEVAWAVAAERYLYIPCAFFSLAAAGYLQSLAGRVVPQRAGLFLAGATLAAVACATVQRTGVWQSNLALFEDTIAKTPGYGVLHNELAVALATEGRLVEARRELDLASSLRPSDLVRHSIARNRVLFGLNDAATPEERRDLIRGYPSELLRKDPEMLTLLRRNDYLILRKLPLGSRRDLLLGELVEVSEQLYAKTKEPLLLYNNGQLLLERGERRQARACFARCVAAAPADAYYRSAAVRLVATLGERP